VDERFGRLRRRHDPAARQGMPAHITLVFPFAEPQALSPEDRRRLAAVFAGAAPLELTFAATGRFAGVLWLAPEPVAAIVDLVMRLAEAFPAYPPYGGTFGTVVPHLTLAQGDEALLSRLERRIAGRLRQPIVAPVQAAVLFATRADRWLPVERFALGG
jgi:2'-5' RNA ligase